MLAITEKLVDGEEGFAGGQVLFCYWTSVLLVYNEHWLILSFFTTCNGQLTCLWPGLGGLRRMPDSHEKWKCAGRIWDGPWSGDLHLLQNFCSIILIGARDTESEWTTFNTTTADVTEWGYGCKVFRARHGRAPPVNTGGKGKCDGEGVDLSGIKGLWDSWHV